MSFEDITAAMSTKAKYTRPVDTALLPRDHSIMPMTVQTITPLENVNTAVVILKTAGATSTIMMVRICESESDKFVNHGEAGRPFQELVVLWLRAPSIKI